MVDVAPAPELTAAPPAQAAPAPAAAWVASVDHRRLGLAYLISAFAFLPDFLGAWIGGTIAGALVAPYQAHVLTVLYYKLTEPERPVLPTGPPRSSWQSVWDEEQG